MTAREQDDRHRPVKSQDSEFIGAFAALRRANPYWTAAVKARRRAFETTGAVAIVKNGKVVWETPEGKLLEESELDARNLRQLN